MTTPDITGQLARYMAEVRHRPLPPDGLRARISQLSARLERSILAVRDLAYDLRHCIHNPHHEALLT